MIVVAIVGILAGIAWVNYHRASVRTKVSVTKSQFRTLAGAMELYQVDHGDYPYPRVSYPEDPFGVVAAIALRGLTTPIAYVSPSAFTDPFGRVRVQRSGGTTSTRAGGFRPPTPGFNGGSSLLYFHYPYFARLVQRPAMNRHGYVAVSVGPDLVDSFILYLPFPEALPTSASGFGIGDVQDTVYDPTNGVTSGGDLAYFGGALPVGPLVGGGER